MLGGVVAPTPGRQGALQRDDDGPVPARPPRGGPVAPDPLERDPGGQPARLVAGSGDHGDGRRNGLEKARGKRTRAAVMGQHQDVRREWPLLGEDRRLCAEANVSR